MRTQRIDFQNIHYEACDIEEALAESILRIGFSFPIHVEERSHEYYCLDGHKRLSAMHFLWEKGELLEKRRMIPVVIINHGDLRSTPHHGMRNHH